VRNAYLAYKTRRLVEHSAEQEGLGVLTKTVTFDVKTLEGLRRGPGSEEGKVFNLVRGLHQELEEEPAAAPVLRPIAERAERILQELENRNTTDLAAMDYLAALAKEKEEAAASAQHSGLTSRAFGVYWSLKDDEALAKAGISAVELAKEAETLFARFPNAQVSDDEQRRLRAALYRPLLGLGKEDRGRIVEAVLAILLDGGSDDASA
jgi:type I restriction enzyme R subunit